MIIDELKDISNTITNNFISPINLISSISFVSLINPINSISPISQPSYHKCNL